MKLDSSYLVVKLTKDQSLSWESLTFPKSQTTATQPKLLALTSKNKTITQGKQRIFSQNPEYLNLDV